jgi:hypothetical protein
MAGDIGSLIYSLSQLVRSPRIQHGLHQDFNQLKRIIPFIGGPFVGNTSHHSGASPIVGQWHNPGADSLGNALGSVLGTAGKIGQYLQQQNDPMTQLYSQLLDQLQQPVAQPGQVNKDDLMRQVQAALNPIYDQEAAKAQAQNTRAQADIKGMYGGLAKDFENLAPQQVAQAKDAQNQIADIYGQLRSNIEGSYARVSNDQADLFKQLGIQSALPDVLDKQQQSVTDASTAASENQAQQQQRYADIGQMDSTYYRQGSPISLMRGNEEGTNLLNQLQDYLGQVESQRAAGIQSGYMDQLGQAQNQLAQQQQAANSETDRRQQMLWQILQSQQQGQQQQQSLTPDTYMQQLPSEMQQSVAGAFTQLQRSPEAVYGKVQDPRSPVPGTFVSVTPQWYMAQADKMLQDGQIDPVTHQALLMYMQLYFGNGNG